MNPFSEYATIIGIDWAQEIRRKSGHPPIDLITESRQYREH